MQDVQHAHFRGQEEEIKRNVHEQLRQENLLPNDQNLVEVEERKSRQENIRKGREKERRSCKQREHALEREVGRKTTVKNIALDKLHQDPPQALGRRFQFEEEPEIQLDTESEEENQQSEGDLQAIQARSLQEVEVRLRKIRGEMVNRPMNPIPGPDLVNVRNNRDEQREQNLRRENPQPPEENQQRPDISINSETVYGDFNPNGGVSVNGIQSNSDSNLPRSDGTLLRFMPDPNIDQNIIPEDYSQMNQGQVQEQPRIIDQRRNPPIAFVCRDIVFNGNVHNLNMQQYFQQDPQPNHLPNPPANPPANSHRNP